MKNWLSDNPIFDTFAQRALFRTYYGGADFGECQSTMGRIAEGNCDDWYREWYNTAERLRSIGDNCLAKGHIVSAREAYLRAATYYHTAYFPLFGAPVDPRLVVASEKETQTFHQAAALFDVPIEVVEIPYKQSKCSTLPAYFIKADNCDEPKPLIVHTNGYDSNIQEMFFYHAPAATRRGYHCLLFDGPGQGRNLIRDHLPMIPNWETVVKQVIDYAAARPDVDSSKIVLVGWSFGGFLAPRAAAFENRLAALVADPGQWDLKDMLQSNFAALLGSNVDVTNIDPKKLASIEVSFRNGKAGPMQKWKIIQRNFWVHGVNNLYDCIQEMLKYEISSVVDQISCPTLLTLPEGDPLAETTQKLYEAIKAPKRLVPFTLAEGAGGHCETMARSLYHQRVFDWLDETLM